MAPLKKKVHWLRRYCRELEGRLTELEEDLEDRQFGEFLHAFELWRNSAAGRDVRRRLQLEGRIGMRLEEALLEAFRDEWNRTPDLTDEERRQLVDALERLDGVVASPTRPDASEDRDEPPF
ncbi:MAG: hypothetical protein HY319_08715 [Armatimonadetes bacterium]|nr:hypothetical protein [Armatimonadota bacterium]